MLGYWDRMKLSMAKYKGKGHPIDKIAYKLRAYSLADLYGVKHARIYGIYSRIEWVNWEELPGQFVIKPQQGCSESGVIPLIKIEEKVNPEYMCHYDLLRDKLMTKKEIIAYFMEGLLPEAKANHSRGLWIEELLSNPIPQDIKVHTFNGKIGVIEQFKRNGKEKYHRYWDAEWKPINNMCTKIFTYIINNTLKPPEHKEEILDTARKLSKAVKHPFVRIDLYDTPRGVYLGEVTPHPGRTCIYIKEWEEKLGRMWGEAEKELGML